MATDALIGLGAEFHLEDDTSPTPVLVQLGEILSVTPPNPQVEDVEARATYPPVRPGENQRHVPLFARSDGRSSMSRWPMTIPVIGPGGRR